MYIYIYIPTPIISSLQLPSVRGQDSALQRSAEAKSFQETWSEKGHAAQAGHVGGSGNLGILGDVFFFWVGYPKCCELILWILVDVDIDTVYLHLLHKALICLS